MEIIEYPDHFQIRQNNETLITKHRFINFWLLITEKQKDKCRFVGKHVPH